jgi:hypothetical protein
LDHGFFQTLKYVVKGGKFSGVAGGEGGWDMKAFKVFSKVWMTQTLASRVEMYSRKLRSIYKQSQKEKSNISVGSNKKGNNERKKNNLQLFFKVFCLPFLDAPTSTSNLPTRTRTRIRSPISDANSPTCSFVRVISC